MQVLSTLGDPLGVQLQLEIMIIDVVQSVDNLRALHPRFRLHVKNNQQNKIKMDQYLLK
jgi:hypothetical protein